MELKDFLNEYVERSREILRDELVGVYLHGSAVMGCFNPETSDVDLIIVVKGPISDAVKRAYMEMVAAANAAGPKKGVEMSVVTADVCRPFVYPTPYELHFSIGHLDRYREDPEAYIREMNGIDPDLAAHFTILRARGRSLYGPAVEEIFGEVPKEDYLDSIWKDVEEAPEEITEYPTYLILNLTRVLACCRDGLVLSKKEGAEWGLEHLPTEYHDLIRAALAAYTRAETVGYDPERSKQYAAYMLREITACKPQLC